MFGLVLHLGVSMNLISFPSHGKGKSDGSCLSSFLSIPGYGISKTKTKTKTQTK